jgi:hypothetical protein
MQCAEVEPTQPEQIAAQPPIYIEQSSPTQLSIHEQLPKLSVEALTLQPRQLLYVGPLQPTQIAWQVPLIPEDILQSEPIHPASH